MRRSNCQSVAAAGLTICQAFIGEEEGEGEEEEEEEECEWQGVTLKLAAPSYGAVVSALAVHVLLQPSSPREQRENCGRQQNTITNRSSQKPWYVPLPQNPHEVSSKSRCKDVSGYRASEIHSPSTNACWMFGICREGGREAV
jgi:hypothetical protein